MGQSDDHALTIGPKQYFEARGLPGKGTLGHGHVAALGRVPQNLLARVLGIQKLSL